MARLNRRSGYSLVLAGAAGVVYFWATDPRSSVGGRLIGDGIDAANHAWPGTVVGIAGSAAALLLGFWLLTRRTV
jgi:hypothetical protein